MGSVQEFYAANLLQTYGYPLHSPGPRGGLQEPYQMEGFQIGDVGYINHEGEFYPLFNICLPLPVELHQHGFPKHKPIDFDDPYYKAHALPPRYVFMAGVNREVNASREAYEFTAKSDAGAILILPSGATLFDLPPNKSHLEMFRQTAMNYARLWCERSGHDSLFLITRMYKTCDFTLASFNAGYPNGKMLVNPDAGTYKWRSQFTVSPRSSPPDNEYKNQTVLIQGFRMTVRWGWLPVVERVTRSTSSISQRTAFLIATLIALLQALFEMVFTWWQRTTVEHISLFAQLSHPADNINRF